MTYSKSAGSVTGSSIGNAALPWIVLTLLGVIWGASFMGAKLALTGFGPMTVAALRIALAALVLLAVAVVLGDGLPAFRTGTDRRIWLHIIGMGIFTNAVPFTLLNWGQLYVTSGFAGITMAVVPLLVLPLAHFLVPGEHLSKRRIAGFLVGFIGVLILIGPERLLTSSGADIEPVARIACVLAACCYAVGSLITRLCPPVKTIPYSAAGLLVASFIMIPLALHFEGLPQTPDRTALAGVIYLGLGPTALATICLVWVINNAGPAFMSQVNYQVPVWAILFGVLLLGEELPGQFMVALVFILAGLAISRTGKRQVV